MDLIAQMKEYLERFIEKPHPLFNNLPVCPFAKKARQTGRLHFVVSPLIVEALVPTLTDFAAGSPYEMIMFIAEEMPLDEFLVFLEAFKAIAQPLGVVVFEGHPDSDYQVGGLFTRRDPFPNVQIILKDHLDNARTQLEKSQYYSRLPPEAWEDWDY